MENTGANIVSLNHQNEMMNVTNGSLIDMKRNLDEMKAKIDMAQQFVKSVMRDGLDYGEIPYTENRTLFQPGADKLNFLYGFARHIVAKDEVKNHQTGHYDVTVRIQLRHKDTGTIVGEGEGSCSTLETKYRYRWVYKRDIPHGIDENTLVKKEFEKRSDGSKYFKYRIENADLFDIWNTILKMAIKRSYVSATLAATGLSGIFQMDEDDFDTWVDGEPSEGKEKLTKVRTKATADDEAGSFKPQTSNGITDSQRNKIFGDAKRKGLLEQGIKDVIQFTKKKPIENLSKAEASAVIEFIGKTSEEDLQDLVLAAAVPGDNA